MSTLATAAAAIRRLLPTVLAALTACADPHQRALPEPVTLGPRPYYLVDQLRPGALRDALTECAASRRLFERSAFSIGHRGAPLQFPEHTRESYIAAARMGAGIVECDVTFTADRQLVCRHAQCDLHRTTNIVTSPLAHNCRVPPLLDGAGRLRNGPDIRCCTSDLTLAEFKTLEGKMDGADTGAATLEGYLAGTAGFRTDLYAGDGRGTLLSHAESIALFRRLGVGMTPELKPPEVPMPFEGDYSQRDYARQLIEEYRHAQIPAHRVWPQSFNYRDVLLWIAEAPDYGRQAVFLDDRQDFDADDPAAVAALEPSMARLAGDGVNILAPPLPLLLTTRDGVVAPSAYARAARQAGLDLIAWTTERSGPLAPGQRDFYYRGIGDAIANDGDILTVIDVLAREVGVIGVFSDWPATTTFYANCRPTARPQGY